MSDRNGDGRLRVDPGATAPKGVPWPQIEATTLAERVYQMVRTRILERELPPGSFVREQEVSRATGVSRTPVREALSRLASEDFLERVPHRGFRVPDRPFEALVEIYPIINALEDLAAKLAIDRITDDDVARMREFNRRLAVSLKEEDVAGSVEYNRAFHRVISDRSGNARLCDLLDQLRTQVGSLDAWHFASPDRLKRSIKEHDAIIAALAARDLAAVVHGLKANYSRARQRMQKELDERAGRAAD